MLLPIRSLWSLWPAVALTAGLLAAPGPLGTAPAFAASFDCARASNPTEQAICGDPQLSQLDGELGVAYQARLAADPGLKQIQRGWLLARNAGCQADHDCLRLMMTAELSWLNGSGRPPGAMPRKVGACSLTTISKVTSRFEDEPESGSAVETANGVYGVSYDVVPPIVKSRRGDPAVACLAQLPSDCPPGDDRGKVYAVANLRTLGAWSLPDAEHLCGGA